jgi:hypothetical protein
MLAARGLLIGFNDFVIIFGCAIENYAKTGLM